MESIADRFIRVMAKIAEIEADVGNDNPHRYPIRKMRMTADSILNNALSEAESVADTAKVLKDELRGAP